MYLQLDTEINGADLNINAVTLRQSDLTAEQIAFYASVTGPSADRYRFVQDTDLPVDVETFLNNFDKYEFIAGVGGDIVSTIAPTLKSGETVATSRFNDTPIDPTIPLALTRANKATIFENL